MTNQHPITPPPELVRQWYLGAKAYPPDQIVKGAGWGVTDVATQAAQWGADQELEACVELLKAHGYKGKAIDLRNARRPKPLSLKEQALAELAATERCHPADYSTIRKALEALPND